MATNNDKVWAGIQITENWDKSIAMLCAYLRAIITLRRNPEKSKGCHVVYGGLNAALADYAKQAYPEVLTDPTARLATVKMLWAQAIEAGAVVTVPCKGGAMAYLAEDGAEVKARQAVRDGAKVNNALFHPTATTAVKASSVPVVTLRRGA